MMMMMIFDLLTNELIIITKIYIYISHNKNVNWYAYLSSIIRENVRTYIFCYVTLHYYIFHIDLLNYLIMLIM